MKKLGNIKINTEKLIKEDELLILRGGDYGCNCKCYTWDGQYVQDIPWATPLTCNPLCLFAITNGYGDC